MNYDEQLKAMRGYGEKIPVEEGEQGSISWLQSRVGFCTCSRFADATDFLKNGKSSAKREQYKLDTVVERLTNIPTDHYVSKPMEHGTEQQPHAVKAYERKTGAMVTEPGFIHHKTIKWVGGSCDGLIDDDGIIEVKAPNTGTHIKTLLSGECEHLPQIMGYLWLTGRKYCDFVSFDPRLPNGLDLFIKRIPRDESYIAELAAGVLNFLAEVDVMHKELLAIADANATPDTDESADDIPPLEL